MLTAIIVAGGSSRRMGFDKTFALLAGKPVIAHTIAAFETCASVRDIVIVGRAERLDEFNRLVSDQRFEKVRRIVAGGVHRQHSVHAGLDCLSAEATHVAVHDAARPLVRPEDIDAVFSVAKERGAAALAASVTDTLKRATPDRIVSGSVDREGLYAMQTPQIFSRELLLKAYRVVESENLSITDEVSAVERLGHDAVLVPNEAFNFKITYPHDLVLAELVIESGRRDASSR